MRARSVAALLVALAVAVPVRAASRPDAEIAAAKERLRREPDSADACVALATGFMRKARESADPSYYGRARAAVDRALALEPAHYEAARVRAWVLLGLHDFRGALATAEEAQRRAPDDWWNDGTLADASVELGDYPRALGAAQRMVDARPGLPSYTRAAWLRALHGDRGGAMRLLRLALDAASPRDPESLAWTLVQLGNEHFATGDLARAGAAYERALEVFPDHALALAGVGRVRAGEGRLDDAIAAYRRAVEIAPAPDVVAALGDACAARGDAGEAERQWRLVEYMGRVAEANGTTWALRLARLEAASRDDVYTDDALAWALYKTGRFRAAARASHRALRLGTPDALFLYHAGLIAAALDHVDRATRDLRRALALNPWFDLRQAPQARAVLAALDGGRAALASR
jgi:tetratricopeptide (TPR) repeat protein